MHPDINTPRAEEEQQEPHVREPDSSRTCSPAETQENKADSTSMQDIPRSGDSNMEPICDQFNEMEHSDRDPWLSKYSSHHNEWITLLSNKVDMPSNVFIQGFTIYSVSWLMGLPWNVQRLIAD